jgi:hypothetical protein
MAYIVVQFTGDGDPQGPLHQAKGPDMLNPTRPFCYDFRAPGALVRVEDPDDIQKYRDLAAANSDSWAIVEEG